MDFEILHVSREGFRLSVCCVLSGFEEIPRKVEESLAAAFVFIDSAVLSVMFKQGEEYVMEVVGSDRIVFVV